MGHLRLEQVSSTALSEQSFRKGWGAKAGETRGTRGRSSGEDRGGPSRPKNSSEIWM